MLSNVIGVAVKATAWVVVPDINSVGFKTVAVFLFNGERLLFKSSLCGLYDVC